MRSGLSPIGHASRAPRRATLHVDVRFSCSKKTGPSWIFAVRSPHVTGCARVHNAVRRSGYGARRRAATVPSGFRYAPSGRSDRQPRRAETLSRRSRPHPGKPILGGGQARNRMVASLSTYCGLSEFGRWRSENCHSSLRHRLGRSRSHTEQDRRPELDLWMEPRSCHGLTRGTCR